MIFAFLSVFLFSVSVLAQTQNGGGTAPPSTTGNCAFDKEGDHIANDSPHVVDLISVCGASKGGSNYIDLNFSSYSNVSKAFGYLLIDADRDKTTGANYSFTVTPASGIEYLVIFDAENQDFLGLYDENGRFVDTPTMFMGKQMIQIGFPTASTGPAMDIFPIVGNENGWTDVLDSYGVDRLRLFTAEALIFPKGGAKFLQYQAFTALVYVALADGIGQAALIAYVDGQQIAAGSVSDGAIWGFDGNFFVLSTGKHVFRIVLVTNEGEFESQVIFETLPIPSSKGGGGGGKG